LDTNFIEDKSLGVIIEALQINKTLKFINLFNNDFTDDGKTRLIEAVTEINESRPYNNKLTLKI